MSLSKKIAEIPEPLTIDIQLIAAELDTSAKGLRYISSNEMTDAIMNDAFNNLVEDIETNGDAITLFDDYTTLFEFDEEPVILYTVLTNRYVIYDVGLIQKMECKLNSYK